MPSAVELGDAYIIIEHLPKGKDGNYIYFTLPSLPDSVQDTMQSRFAETNALSRSAPIYTYSYSGPREVEVKIPLHFDLVEEQCKTNADVKEGETTAEAFVRYIQSISVPRYTVQDKAVIPPVICISLGPQIYIRGIVNSGVTVMYEKPIVEGDKYINLEVSFRVYEIKPYDAEAIAQYGSNRGRTSVPVSALGYED